MVTGLQFYEKVKEIVAPLTTLSDTLTACETYFSEFKNFKLRVSEIIPDSTYSIIATNIVDTKLCSIGYFRFNSFEERVETYLECSVKSALDFELAVLMAIDNGSTIEQDESDDSSNSNDDLYLNA